MAHPFEGLRIGSMQAPNRFVRAATCDSLATSDGRPTRQMLAKYAELARGGIGIIETGYAFVTPDGKPSEGALGISDDAFMDDYRALTDVMRAGGSAAVLQLVYGGSKSKLASDDPRRIISDAAVGGGAVNVDIVGPSPVAHPRTALVPRQATSADLARIRDAFASAAVRARACGFDGVELHAAHGYLLGQFLSPHFNRRDDDYGGTVENRARFAGECLRAMRAAVGPDYPLIVKLNCCDARDDPEGAEYGGLGLADSREVAALLVQAGASALEISGDWHAFGPGEVEGEPFFAEFGAQVAADVDVPVIVTGGWRKIDAVERVLAQTRIAAVGMSRPFICEPALAQRWASGSREPARCISCNQCGRAAGLPCVQHGHDRP